jgi:hypothetical protein
MDERDTERWLRRFEAAPPLERAKLVGGGAVRLTARLLDRALSTAARTVAEAEHAFRRELDPTMEEAKILDERPRDESRDVPPPQS